MGWLKQLFSAPETISKTVDAAYAGVDKTWFTPEERAEATASAQQIYQAMWLAAVPSAISRRIITVFVTFVWAFCVLLMVGLGVFQGSGEGSPALYVKGVLTDVVMQPFSIILGFYFLAKVVTDFKK